VDGGTEARVCEENRSDDEGEVGRVGQACVDLSIGVKMCPYCSFWNHILFFAEDVNLHLKV
jgi:hypothetical protein